MDIKIKDIYNIFVILLVTLFWLTLLMCGIGWKGIMILFVSSLLPVLFLGLYNYTNKKIYKYISIAFFILKVLVLIMLIRLVLFNYYTLKEVNNFFDEISD